MAHGQEIGHEGGGGIITECCIHTVLQIRFDLFRIRKHLWIFRVLDQDPGKSSWSMRGSNPYYLNQGFGVGLIWGGCSSGIFFIRSRLRLLVKEKIIFEFFKTDYELSKIRSNTCTSTCWSYFMFTVEKTSNNVKFHVIFVTY